MLIRIYIPEYLYSASDKTDIKCEQYIYGSKVIDANDKITSFYVIDSSSSSNEASHCKYLIGTISQETSDTLPSSPIQSDYLYFKRRKDFLALQTIHLSQSPTTNATNCVPVVQIFLYDHNIFAVLSKRSIDQSINRKCDPIGTLLSTIAHSKRLTEASMNGKRRLLIINYFKAMAMFAQTRVTSIGFNSAFIKHLSLWTYNLDKLICETGRIWTFLFDLFAGVMIMLFLWHVSNADEYLMRFTMMIVKYLQQLLEALDGSPAGLKLNIELNTFLLTYFRYHVDLWATFLVIVAPLVKWLFMPITIIGCFGLSFQLSILADLLNIITLHAHCIYIYVSILYRIEKNGLVGLWRVVSGRKENVLKNRVESHEFTNTQLYLSGLFFASLLFLLPTCLVYYVVFASLHFGFYCITYTLTLIREKLLCLPLLDIIKWCCGKCYSTDNFEIVRVIDIDGSSNDTTAVFRIQGIRTLPKWYELTIPPNGKHANKEN